jgi:hypothetical protein
MNEHLTSSDITEWLAGQRTAAMECHVRSCQDCAAELRRASAPLEMFGNAVRCWSEDMDVVRPLVPMKTPLRMGRLALAAAALVAVIAVPVHRRDAPKPLPAATTIQDEVLLRQVESGLSRSVPAPMEPLAKLMWSDAAY